MIVCADEMNPARMGEIECVAGVDQHYPQHRRIDTVAEQQQHASSFSFQPRQRRQMHVVRISHRNLLFRSFFDHLQLFRVRLICRRYCFFVLLVLLPVFVDATIFSNSLQSCFDQCQNHAVPLASKSMTWENLSVSSCDYDCFINSCHTGCQDLDSFNSTCGLLSHKIASMQPGEWFGELFSDLLNQVSVEAAYDLFAAGIRLNWTFGDVFLSTLREISTTNLRWFTQSRAKTTLAKGWTWVEMDPKAYKEATIASAVIPVEETQDIQVRLLAVWRESNIAVSPTFAQSVFLESHHAHARPQLVPGIGPGLWLSRNECVVCWSSSQHDVHEVPLFRLRLLNATDTSAKGGSKDDDEEVVVLATHSTSASCFLVRDVPAECAQCTVEIAEIIQNKAATDDINASSTTTPVSPIEASSSSTNDVSPSLKVGKELLLNITETRPSSPCQQQQCHNVGEVSSHGDNPPLLVVTNGTELFILEDPNDYVLLPEPKCFSLKLTDNQTITALASLSARKLLIGLSDGTIGVVEIARDSFVFSHNNNSTAFVLATRLEMSVIRKADGVEIQQIAVDQIQERLYAVRNRSGVVRCMLESCENATFLANIYPSNYIQGIAIDSQNGFIYYVTNSSEVWQTPLFPLHNAPRNHTLSIVRRLSDLPPVFTLEVDSARQKLFAVTKQSQILSRDFVDEAIVDERLNMTLSDSYKNVTHSQLNSNRLFWTSTNCGEFHQWESCLYSEEFDARTKSVHLNKYLFSGPARAFTLLRELTAMPLLVPPAKVGLVVDETEARLSWKPPTPLPFQAPGFAWRNISYEYSLALNTSGTHNSMPNENGSFSLLFAVNTTQTNAHIQFSVAKDDQIQHFVASVRTCYKSLCSVPATAQNHPLNADRVRKSVVLYTKTTLSAETAASASTSADSIAATSFGDFVDQQSGGGSKALQPAAAVHYSVFNLFSKEIRDGELLKYPRLPSDPSLAIAFDNSSSSLYIYSGKELAVFRGGRSSDSAAAYDRFLDSGAISQMVVMPSRSVILLASPYSILSYRLTGTFDRIVYNCATASVVECREVIGIAADDTGLGRVFFLTRQQDGSVHLFSLNDVQHVPQLIGSAKSLSYEIRQMAALDDRIVFLTTDGQVGSFDLHLESVNMNFNFGLRDVAFLLVADWVERATALRFQRPIQFDEKQGQLTWSVEQGGQTPQFGDVIYRVELYQDGFGGRRTVSLTQTPSYNMLPSLLEHWESRQKFDVKVVALNPWCVATTNKTGLSAPNKPPTPPQNLRIFATQQKTIEGTRAIIDLFWDEPREWNGDKLGYIVNCSINAIEGSYANGSVKASAIRSFAFLVKSGKVSCTVSATNDQHSSSLLSLSSPAAAEIASGGALTDVKVSAPSESISIDGSEFRPLIRLFTIDSTFSLVAIQNWSTPLTEAPPSFIVPQQSSSSTRHKTRRQSSVAQYQSMAFIGKDLYAIRKEPDSAHLSLLLLDINSVGNVLYKATLNGEFGQIEAIASDWVANRLLIVANKNIMQISMDSLQDTTLISPRELFSLSPGAQDAKQLVFDPFANTAYLLTKNGSLFSINLVNGTEQNLALTLDCLRSQTVTAVVGEFIWNRPNSPLIYALTWNGMITIQPNGNLCSDVNVNWALLGDKGQKSTSLFTVADKLFIFVTSGELLVYDRRSDTVFQMPVQNPPLRQILAASLSSQPYPDKDCFRLPPPGNINFTVRNEGRTGAIVDVLDPPIVNGECRRISFPQTQYELHFSKRGADKVKIINSPSNRTIVENGILDKQTDYEVAVGISPIQLFHTGFGYPSQPLNPRAFSLTPDSVFLTWNLPNLLNAPANEIRYRVTQLTPTLASPTLIAVKQMQLDPNNGAGQQFSTIAMDVVTCTASPCQVKIPNLRSSTDYHFWVSAVHVTRLAQSLDDAETSTEALARTEDIPGTLRVEGVTSESVLLKWSTLNPGSLPSKVFIQYKQGAVDASWTELHNSSFDPLAWPIRNITLGDLRSATAYDIRFVAEYSVALPEKKNTMEPYHPQLIQTRTKAGVPTAPQDVHMERVKEKEDINSSGVDEENWVLRWKPPLLDGGEKIQNYAVEYRPNSQAEWEIAERGLSPERFYWRIGKLWRESSSGDWEQAEFRVRAANSEGFGAYGSSQAKLPEIFPRPFSATRIVLYCVVGLLGLLVIVCLIVYVIARYKFEKKRRWLAKLQRPISLEEITNQIKIPISPMSPVKFTPEVEHELQILPKIARNCIDLKNTRRLGQGSFGEVVEGRAVLERYGGKRMSVAIKYLKDNPSPENRLKFLKEAIIMNNFDHTNIVKLLGVCIADGDFLGSGHFLVFELMEGGDLHCFLLDSRPHGEELCRISMRDLSAIMVDICRGCFYLEKHKHVHRDLDIYANDYYRVNTDDMLPLRWLSPEALKGLFTSKSDVWAYGVLLWEILTLGAQPYEGVSNLEVLGKLTQLDSDSPPLLERPYECPDNLWELMTVLWIVDIERRPRFADFMAHIEALRGTPELQNGDPFPWPSASSSSFDSSQDSSIKGSSAVNSTANETGPFDHSGIIGGAHPPNHPPSTLLNGGNGFLLHNNEKNNGHLALKMHRRFRRSSKKRHDMAMAGDRESTASGETSHTNVYGHLGYETPRSMLHAASASSSPRHNSVPTLPELNHLVIEGNSRSPGPVYFTNEAFDYSDGYSPLDPGGGGGLLFHSLSEQFNGQHSLATPPQVPLSNSPRPKPAPRKTSENSDLSSRGFASSSSRVSRV